MNLERIKGMKFKAQDYELDPEKMKFFPVINGDTIDLIIYAKGVTGENYNQIAYGGLLLLDNILANTTVWLRFVAMIFTICQLRKKSLKAYFLF
jgi:hypothetical protein